jgi:hypothetical protein
LVLVLKQALEKNNRVENPKKTRKPPATLE